MKKLIAAALIACLCCGCTADNKEDSHEGPKTAEEAAASIETEITADTEHVREAYLNRTIGVTGSFSSDKTVNPAPKVSGKVSRVNVRLGDYVKTGDMLIEIDPTDILLDIDLKEANLKQQLAVLGMTSAEQSLPPKDTLPNVKKAKVNMENNKLTYDRKVKEREQDLISDQDVDNALTAYKSSKADYENQIFYADRDYAGVQTAKTQLAISRQNLSYTKVTAPIDGIVQQQKIYEGDIIQAGSPCFVIVSISPLLLDISIPQKYASRFPEGKEVEIRTDAADNRSFKGRITRISPVTDAVTRAVPVQAEVENPSKNLKPGMFSDITLVYDRTKALMVPRSAIVENKGVSKVFIIRNGEASEIEVSKGDSLGTWIEITPVKTGTIHEGDMVAVSGAAGLSDGIKVKLGKQGNDAPLQSNKNTDEQAEEMIHSQQSKGIR